MAGLDPRVERNIEPEPNSGCWLWRGTLLDTGYGNFQYRGIKHRLAHRYVYESLVGKIPDGLVIDHKCRVRSCCNPDHLEPVTTGENIRRGMVGIVARQRLLAITHCRHGHPLSGENLKIARNGQRVCRACERRWKAKYSAKQIQKEGQHGVQETKADQAQAARVLTFNNPSV